MSSKIERAFEKTTKCSIKIRLKRTIFRQLKRVIDLVGLPWICVGDCNIDSVEFEKSEWPGFLKGKMIHPNTETTIKTSVNRIIDFAIVSQDISRLIDKSEPVFSVPWGPHWGQIYTISVKPQGVVGNVACVLKPFPAFRFQEHMEACRR